MKKHLPQAISHPTSATNHYHNDYLCRSTFLQEVMFISLFTQEINKRMIRQLIADKYGMKSRLPESSQDTFLMKETFEILC